MATLLERLDRGESIDLRGDGKAGGGLVLAVQAFGAALAHAGFDVQDWPLFSSARKGANVRAFLRFARQPIEAACQVTAPDIVVLMSEAAAREVAFAAGARRALFVINSASSPEEAAARYQLGGRVVTIDGDGLGTRLLGRPLGNIPVFAALVHQTGLVSREMARSSLEQSVRKRRLPERMVAANLQLFDEAEASLRAGDFEPGPTTEHPSKPFTDYGALPVGAQAALRSARVNHTAGYGRPGVGITFADVAGRCNGCSLCVVQCPEGIIEFTADPAKGTIVHGARFVDYCKVCRECVTACPLDLFHEVAVVTPPKEPFMSSREIVAPYGAHYPEAIDLEALRRAHLPAYRERTTVNVDGNTAAALPFLQWWRSPIVGGFPITPATKWLEYLATESVKRVDARGVRTRRVKLLESEHAVADYLTGVAAACRELVTGTASSSVGLDHMAESLRSLGASGLGNIIVVDVCRATANYPLCIEGDSSDVLAHRDDGFIQVMCRGKQQIYDTILQMPALGMHPDVLTPTMPSYFGIKDSHRNGKLVIEPDDEVNAFLDAELTRARATAAPQPPGLLDGDTAMGNCVTSAWFQGFKVGQKRRQQRALALLEEIGERFATRFGRPGLSAFEAHAMDDAEAAIVCMGPDTGTALQLLPSLRAELGLRIGVIALRLLTPFPSAALGRALARVGAVAVVNNAHHHGRGHLTLDVVDALHGLARGEEGNPLGVPISTARALPVDSFFCGLGGADVSVATWRRIARTLAETAQRGRSERPWHLLHDGVDIDVEAQS